jgi:hypothetical protein
MIGQVWYNSTSSSWKVTSVTTAGAWATSGNLNTARGELAGCRNSNCSFSFWWIYWYSSLQDATEEYNGTSWTSHPPGTLNTTRESLQ